jgi:glutamate-5-semialdehyde dehydrogenase
MVEVPVKMYVANLAKKAKETVRPMASLPTAVKDEALILFAERLIEKEGTIREANEQDIEAVGKGLTGESNKDRVKEAVDRVRLSEEAFQDIAENIQRIARLPDPVGEMPGLWQEENGMQVSRMRVPIGLIGVICDLAPDVALETIALCLKSGNPVLVRLSPDWSRTYQVIADILQEALRDAGVPSGAVSIIGRPEKEAALELMRLHQMLNAIIPRGGAGLRKIVQEHARVPVLGHDGGLCHLYIDADADPPMAQTLVVNSKVQRPGSVNSVDTVLVHKAAARTVLTGLIRRLLDEFKVQLHGCPKTMALMGSMTLTGYLSVKAATEEDWNRQFLSRGLALKIVETFDEALDHIAGHSPCHTAMIVTRDYGAAMRFVREVDAGAVLVNASTRLDDGHELGLGGDLGMSAMRTHTRGPIGLNDLTCEKYVVLGTGQLREPHPVPAAYEDAIMLKKGMG